MLKRPLNPGDLVRIKQEPHHGVFRVRTCLWFAQTLPGVPPYWLACIRAIEGGRAAQWWRGSAEHLEKAS